MGPRGRSGSAFSAVMNGVKTLLAAAALDDCAGKKSERLHPPAKMGMRGE